MESHDIGGIVRRQFLALVEGHYLQRVPRPNSDLLSSDDVVNATPLLQDRFLPPPTEGTNKNGCGTSCQVISRSPGIKFNSRKRKREGAGEEATDEGTPHAKKAKNQDCMEEPEAKRRKGYVRGERYVRVAEGYVS